MIHLHNILKSYPDKVLFKDMDVVIKSGSRIGLVGANGSGKTTLLRMIVGEEEPEKGDVHLGKKLSIGYLPQEITVDSDETILQEVLSEFPVIRDLEKQIEAASQRVSRDPEDSQTLKRLGNLQQEFERLDGWSIEARAKKVLGGLGFTSDKMGLPLNQFSGGWRMRVALAKLLFREPDILLLDEPTNHLDLVSLIWLEDFLNEWKGSLVLISHDRTFLDKTVDHIFEIDHQRIEVYSGNYSKYLAEKRLRREQQVAAYRNQQKLIIETERFIERFRYKDSKASQVQSRVKMLEKLERILPPEGESAHIAVRVPQPERAPRIVAEFSGAKKHYGRLEVFNHLNLQIERGQKIGLVGPNGAGKSTLLKMLAGVEPLTGGALKLGNEVRRAYFAQHQFESLPMASSIYDLISNANPKWTTTEVRTYLGSFLFSGDSIDKKIQVLSGGEVSRLALAKMLVNPSHLILLDEPTNHLDMVSRDVVQEAITSYTGTMVCISHDRHFLNDVTNLIIEVDGGTITPYPGNYEYYEWRKSQTQTMIAAADEQQASSLSGPQVSDYSQRKKLANRLKKIPQLLEACEADIAAQDAILNDPQNATEYARIETALARKEALETDYLELLQEQETLTDQFSG